MNKELLFQEAAKRGIEGIELYRKLSGSTTIEVYEQAVESFKTSDTCGIAIRGIYQGKMGNTYIEEDTDANIEVVLTRIIENASAVSSSDVMTLQSQGTYVSVDSYDKHIDAHAVEDIVALLKMIETKLLASDPRITKVIGCRYAASKATTAISNSCGLDVEHTGNMAMVSATCVAEQDGDTQSHWDYVICSDLAAFDCDAFVTTISKTILCKLKAQRVTSGAYQTILKNDVVSNLLANLTQLFSADTVQKGISIFKDKKGQKIASELLTLRDDPHMPKGFGSVPFDDEGVATYAKNVIDKGILKTFLYNAKTAAKDNIASTGNGFKDGYQGSVDTAPTNFFIVPGTMSYDAMIKEMAQGVIITEIMGIHSGLNSVTAEFSLEANGFYVENGVIVKPLSLITIAGTFAELLQNVVAVGDDFRQDLSGCGSPSLLISSLQIAGE